MDASAPLPPPAFLPVEPPAHRWSGDGLELPPGTLVPEEFEALTRLYHGLEALYREWLASRGDPDWAALAEGVRGFGRPPFSELHDVFGASTRRRESELPVLARRALHDLRGGAFFALRLYSELLPESDPDPNQVEAAVFLARDQAKVVRSLVPAVDPEGHERDRTEKDHGMRELVDKWSGFTFPRPEGEVAVRVEAPWRGNLAARCLEAAALDRVVYNLVNNAARFAASGEVTLRVERASVAAARFSVRNPIDAAQHEWLTEAVGGEPGTLFLGGATRGGQGVGMSSGASIVARAWGQVEARDAVATGAVGARFTDRDFIAWFHWPILAAAPPTLAP